MAVTAKKPAKKKAKKINLQPLGDRIVVLRDESEETTAGGIVLPGAAQDKPNFGTVVSVGTGRLLADGSRAPFSVSKGDHILFTSYAPNEITIDDQVCLLMKEEDVLAIIG